MQIMAVTPGWNVCLVFIVLKLVAILYVPVRILRDFHKLRHFTPFVATDIHIVISPHRRTYYADTKKIKSNKV